MSDSTPLRVLLAHGERDARDALHKILRELRQDEVQICDSGRALIDAALENEPHLIVTGIDLPEVDGLTALLQISEQITIPAIVVTKQNSLEAVEKALQDHVLAYLLEPLRTEEILPTIYLVLRRFEEFQELRQEVESLKQALGDRKLIERAKGMLMQRSSLDEATAYKRLRRFATDHRIRLVQAADRILSGEVIDDSEIDAI